ncbi:MAG: DUF268 domain-containing protein [Chlamydiae bacterium]|nr:DUF268 domain-containing protein [Chlamydiota bacterium]
MKIFAFISIFYFLGGFASPPRNIPIEYYDSYTMGREIPVIDFYIDQSGGETKLHWPKKWVDELVVQATLKQRFYYGETDAYLYNMLKKYPIKGKRVLIVGSETPWYEAIVLAYGGKPITVEYRDIETDDPRLEIYKAEDFFKNPFQCDCILSISSIEHDGLGRYGDPINPDGDLQFMQRIKGYLKDGGLFYLAVPVGADCLCWNAHRIYGDRRFPKLISGWKIVDKCGLNRHIFKREVGFQKQPVFVLAKNEI